MKTTLLSAAVVAAAATAASPAFAGAVLDKIRANDQLVCGVNTSAPGFSSADSKGHWEGLDVNLCRSVAAAVLGNADKVKYVPLSSTQHMTALASGQIDMLARNTTWTMTRDASHGNVFVAVSYYDGQAFMVPKSLGVKSLKELDGATVCVQTGTTTEKTTADYFRSHGMQYKTVVFDTTEATQGAFLSGRCDAIRPTCPTWPAFVRWLRIPPNLTFFRKRSPRNLLDRLFDAEIGSFLKSFAGPLWRSLMLKNLV